MPLTPWPPRARRLALVTVLALVVVALALPPLLAPWIGQRLRSEAAARGFEARWRSLSFAWPAHLELRDLAVTRPDGRGATVARVRADLGLHGFPPRPRLARWGADDVRIALPATPTPEDESPLTDDRPQRGAPAAPRVRAAAAQLIEAALLPARRFPELSVTGLVVTRGDSSFARLDAFTLSRVQGGVQLAATGAFTSDLPVPFSVAMQWHADDRLQGRVAFDVPDPAGAAHPLTITVDGRLTQDRRAGRVRLADGTRVEVGGLPLVMGATLERDGPRFSGAIEVVGATATGVQRALPRPVLGPLADLPVVGSWDWRASLVLDVGEPDRCRFTADVVPHGLAIRGSDANLRLARLAGPFVATLHVPRGTVVRDLSNANPHFRSLDRIAPELRDAVVTNEDGGFHRHRGFNTAALEGAMAANLRAGRFERGAGTITMQLARNLFLGHRRTLSRKGQEIVLAWVIEHLTPLSKDRLLEIYLNVIEWGPGVHGADEGARFYFDKDAGDLTLDEALFMTVVVPSPSRWRSRLAADGTLRPWARAQMAFIARKMAERGVLDPARVPVADSLRVTLRGEAARAFAPAADSALTGLADPL